MAEQETTLRFNEIYDSTFKSVLSFVTAKCSNTTDIQDIVQDTYVELYRLIEKRGADYIINSKALIMRIAKQKLSRYYSLKDRLKIFLPITFSDEGGDETLLADFEADAFLTEDFIVSHLTLEEAKQVIQKKPKDVKKVFYLFFDLGHSIPEVARMLSMSESNVKHKLYRTLNELRSLLNERV